MQRVTIYSWAKSRGYVPQVAYGWRQQGLPVDAQGRVDPEEADRWLEERRPSSTNTKSRAAVTRSLRSDPVYGGNGQSLEEVRIETNIREYIRDVRPLERYASFDYCFNYFQSFREQERLAQLSSADHLQESCLQLGFYLASWGMLRGSSYMLRKSVKVYAPIIDAITRADSQLWDIDAHCYTPSNIDIILDFKKTIIRAFGDANVPSDILVTKLMLGVFGNVPAFDTYFKKGFSISLFGRRALEEVGHFFENHQTIIEQYRIPTLDFGTGQPTHRRYSRAKVIDMIFFIEGSRPS